MKISTLKDRPELYQEVISLIESEFQYPKENSFEIDFFPLIAKENHQNCYLLLGDNEVIGHIGVRIVNILNLPIAFLGGIAIKSSHQGLGLFQNFFKDVLSKHSHCAFYSLWSDKHKLYEKFHFYPAIKLYEYAQNDEKRKFDFLKTDLESFFKKDLSLINNNYISPLRDEDSIQSYSSIKSVDVFFKESNKKVTDYFFVNKGADLEEIIHESFFKDTENFKEAISRYECWSPIFYEEENYQEVASCLIKIGDKALFSQFIDLYTKSHVQILAVTKEVIHFSFQGENLNLSIEEFLQGVFGPSEFEEIKELNLTPLFIPGIDSI